MDIGSTKRYLGFLMYALCAIMFLQPSAVAQDFSTRPADLVNNEKVIYTLPDVGSISPDNPLFFLKQIRDGVVLAIQQDPLVRIRTLIQFGDKYSVYAEKLAHLSKTQRSIETYHKAMEYQHAMIDLLKEESKKQNVKEDDTYIELRNIANQSNIKQAEMIRLLIDDVSTSEQPSFVHLLDKNIQLRKKLQEI